ncbi:unnamed protein product [Peronospora belbahrii]|uniref:Uncharacterized protein n=1 Tax=Peronospora belbahrii TaxID=622444 RepID=A0ABN8D5U9_9STRA|nr:unnamed protein product [Peronospora belbahrii]
MYDGCQPTTHCARLSITVAILVDTIVNIKNIAEYSLSRITVFTVVASGHSTRASTSCVIQRKRGDTTNLS